MSKQPTTPADGQDYSGPSGISRDSVWLTNEDIPHTQDTIVTIDRVLFFKEVTYPNTATANNVLAVTFKGSSRMLRVNATMKRTLNRLAGDNRCGAWKGLRIALFVKQDVRYANGSIGPAVRIRGELPPDPQRPAEQAVEEAHDDIDADYERHAAEEPGDD